MKRKFQKFLRDNGYVSDGYGYKRVEEIDGSERVHWVTLFDEHKKDNTVDVQFYSYDEGMEDELNYSTGIVNINIGEFYLLVGIFSRAKYETN